jgi:hypothetical protein
MKLSRVSAFWAILCALTIVSSFGIKEPAYSQAAINGQIIAGPGINVTTSNSEGCIPASGINCTVSLAGSGGTYFKAVATTGFSYTFGNNQTIIALAPAGGLSTGTFVMPAAPTDGQTACFFSTQAITTLTVSANANQSINNAVTTLAANTRNCFLFSLSNSTWDRSL